MKTIEADAEDQTDAIQLLTPEAVRMRAHQFLQLARDDQLSSFSLHEDKLDGPRDHVIRLMESRFPNGKVPFHARWRHFVVNGEDRAQKLLLEIRDTGDKARAQFDLAIISVLLDAGAGPDWRYTDQSGTEFVRSEGLAVASLEMFETGLFSSNPDQPLRADADALQRLGEQALAEAFQVSGSNPLAGLSGRVKLLNALGKRVDEAASRIFPGETPRPGNLFDFLFSMSGEDGVPAREILIALLHALGPIWPDRPVLGGMALGDTWRHDLATGGELPETFVPFHKLSQWLAYSLIEPTESAGIPVTGINDLTGLAEYRNGGLFVDYGVLEPKSDEVMSKTHSPDSQTIIEWRALTVALLDVLADKIRDKVGLSLEQLPLASVLEAGSWLAGREIAREKRTGGGPPIAIDADGTVF